MKKPVLTKPVFQKPVFKKPVLTKPVIRKPDLNAGEIKSLVVSLFISLGTGILSALLTGGGMRQYADLYKPPLAPPGWLFPIVWTILYILMGVASWRIYESQGSDRRLALSLYGNQLLLNMVWPLLFFELKVYFFAFAWLLLLWLLIYLTIRQFLPIDRRAGLLLVPYLVWVTFAGYLNLAIALHYL